MLQSEESHRQDCLRCSTNISCRLFPSEVLSAIRCSATMHKTPTPGLWQANSRESQVTATGEFKEVGRARAGYADQRDRRCSSVETAPQTVNTLVQSPAQKTSKPENEATASRAPDLPSHIAEWVREGNAPDPENPG